MKLLEAKYLNQNVKISVISSEYGKKIRIIEFFWILLVFLTLPWFFKISRQNWPIR